MKLRLIAIIGILLASSIAIAAQPSTTTLSGTVYDQTGAGKSGIKLYVVKTLKDGVVLASPQTVATSGAGGAISLTVLRGSTVYLYSRDIPRFSARGSSGMPFAIPDTPTASIENLALLSSVMVEQGDTVAAGANGRPARIAGNTSETPKFWRQAGTAGIAGLPTWAQPLMAELGDVLITSPTNGQVVKYNSTLGKWTNQADATGGGGGGSLTVQEVDGSPSVASVSIVEFAQAQGFVVTDQGGGTARVDLNAVPYSALTLTGAILNADISASAGIAYSKLAALTASRLLVSDGSGFVSASAVTATEAGHLAGVTSGLQTQIDGKQPVDADLTAIAALSADGLLRKTGGTWAMDSATYLTGNQTITLSGDVTGSGTTAITTTIGAGTVTNAMLAGSIAISKLSITGTPDGSKYLRDDGTWQVPGGGGTVTSVGLSLPAIFTVSGSPVTGSGTLTGSLANQVANTVWAGPATGVDAAPTFRSLVAADIPSHNQAWSTITSTPTTLAGYGITDAQGVDADLTALAGLSGTGIIARTASATFTERTLTGTSNRITITNGDGVSGNPTFDIGSDVVTLTGSQTLTNKTLTSPTINGGAASALTGLGIRSTGAGAFDLTIANSENLTAGRTLTIAVGDADRSLTLSGNATISGSNTGDQTITLTGDVTGSGTGSFAATIANNAVTLGKMAQVATARFLGRTTGGTGDVEALTAAQATALLDAMVGDSGSGGTKGLVPAPASGDAAAGKFLKADGTWAAPAGGGGITIGTTTITSGTVGRMLYEASGNVVGQIPGSEVDANGAIVFDVTDRTSGVASYFTVKTPADTTLTSSSESVGIYFGGNGAGSPVTREWSTGALTTQREYVFVAPTYAFAGASTLTTAATVSITGAPTAGTNATITNALALNVEAGRVRFNEAGTAVSPGIQFRVPNTGFWYSTSFGTDSIGLTSGSAQVMVWNSSTGNTHIHGSYQLVWGSSGLATPDTGLARAAANVLRVTSTSTGAGKLVIGTSSASTTAADLYVVGSSASLTTFRIDSAASPTAPVMRLTNNGTTGYEFWADYWQVQKEASTDPTSSQLSSGDHFSVYRKNDKLVIAYNNGGTITYLTIPLDGSTTTWTQSTTAP